MYLWYEFIYLIMPSSVFPNNIDKFLVSIVKGKMKKIDIIIINVTITFLIY